ncbi:MAG: cupin domain-containing protein [Chloroflexales bacterium]|nr:cupin domain-containing protein [Chloroflexales bacterium]
MTTTTPSALRRIYHPTQKDYATFLETSASTGGKHTLIEIEVAPGGGTVPHYHLTYSERFEVLEGELEVHVGTEKHTLRPGETKTAQINTLHNFKNSTDKTTRFLVELVPGSPGFEQSLQIAYGLATDGKANKQGLPTNIYHLAVIFVMGEGRVPGVMSLLMPVFRLLAARARKKGIEQELIRKYCQ